MKKIYFTLIISVFSLLSMNSQVEQVMYKNYEYDKYYQYALYLGYDGPIDQPDFKYIEYKGDWMTGITFNRYWSWYGIQADVSLAFTNLDSSFNTLLAFPRSEFGVDTVSTFQYYDAYKSKMKKLFLGLGPAFKYQSKSNKFVADIGLMAGYGTVQKGSYLQYGVDESFGDFYGLAVNYTSGYDKSGLFAMKGTLRFNYFFRPDFGVFLGGYYSQFFDAKESSSNDLLTDYNFQNVVDEYYYFEPVTVDIEPPINGISQGLFDIDVVRSASQDNRATFDISSYGIMGGLTWRVIDHTTKLKCPKGYKLCPDGFCYENGCETETSDLLITVKDKISNEIIQTPLIKTSLIQDGDGEEYSSNNKGEVLISDLTQDNYKIKGSLEGVALSENTISKSDFNNQKVIEKVLIYDNPNFILEGMIKSCTDSRPIANVPITITNSVSREKFDTNADFAGKFSASLPEGTYTIESSDKEYLSDVQTVVLANRNKGPLVIAEVCAEKLECNNQIKFKNLLFDLNDYHLTTNSTQELDKLAEFLNAEQDINLEIYSYTDSRGTTEYNQRLSQQRAEETVKFLVNKGISKDRLTATGKGESDLLNNCADGIECSEEEHAINRRTEFKVVCNN